MFFNITAFPVLTITIRNNLLKAFTPDKLPSKSWKITRWTLFYTLIIVIPILLISLSTTKIESVINVVAGIFGVFILILFPSGFVYFGRKKLRKYGYKIDECMHLATLKYDFLPPLMLFIGVAFLLYHIYTDIYSWVN